MSKENNSKNTDSMTKTKEKPKKSQEKEKLEDIKLLKDKLHQKQKILFENKNLTENLEKIKSNYSSISNQRILEIDYVNQEQITKRDIDPNLGIKTIKPEVRAILPKWTEKPYMYLVPKDGKRLELFLQEWSDFFLVWMEVNEIFIVPLRDLFVEYPFKNPFNKKSLSLDQLQYILQYLVDNERAEWLDRKKTRIKVLWLTHEEIADEIYQWSLDYFQEILVVPELKKIDKPWSKLPSEDLRKSLGILIKNKRAEKIDKNSVKMIFEF